MSTGTLSLNYTNKVTLIFPVSKNILYLGFLDNAFINYFTVTCCTITSTFNAALLNKSITDLIITRRLLGLLLHTCKTKTL